MNFFATEYTIHFDDTMAYGSHHFLTAFKFQCASRESFLFGEQIFDVPGVRESLDEIHLFTSDAYARNLNPARLGDRIAILLTLEEWQRASARFCYRVINAQGEPICAGFQTLICADARTQIPTPLPPPLWEAMQQLREIEEVPAEVSFRDRVLAGGRDLESLFGETERQTAIQFLTQRYPNPQVIPAARQTRTTAESDSAESPVASESAEEELEAWVFSGQGAFDSNLLSERINAYVRLRPSARGELEQCAAVVEELIEGGDSRSLICGSGDRCQDAVKATPELSQVGIHLQNVLGGILRQAEGHSPGILMGHSFGEIAALQVGGCFDLPTGVRIVCERIRSVAEFGPPNGGLLVVATDRPRVATEATLLGLDHVVIAGRNHDQQTVVSGPLDQLERLTAYLRGCGIDAVGIPSPTSFHHPQLRRAAAVWLEKLRALPLTGPSLSVYSPIGRRFISADDDIAATLASQFLRPFDLQGGIADVIGAGVTRFVDCGSSGSLARIISRAGPEGITVSGADSNATDSSEQRLHGDGLTDANEIQVEERDANSTSCVTIPDDASIVNRSTEAPVAIVGMGCILPGGATSPEQLHAAIIEQRSGIVDQRNFDRHWSEDFYSEKLVPDRSTSFLTGRVNDTDLNVPPGIDSNVFHGFTRAQKLLCIALAPCLPSLKDADRVLCLIGATADGFEDQDVVSSLRLAGVDPTDPEVDARLNTIRSAFQEPHDAIQEVFDRVIRPGLDVVLVDAACASSLYAVALGMQALESDEADAVVAGGVFCPGPGNSCLFSQFHGTTSTGCRPFDSKADGVVFSEGSALVALRRRADAESLGLSVSAILRGAGLSSDGRSSSANVPQSRGQLLSLQRCYANYGIDRESIDAIEAHGTSTPVGDATELETLQQFFSGRVAEPIPVHSLKGLLGHAGWAAGTASIIAACEYLRSGVYPAQAGFCEPSTALLKCRETLTVPDRTLNLPSPACRIAIDGFGFGGANAHLVLDAYTTSEPVARRHLDEDNSGSRRSDELVFVAFHELVPTLATPRGLRFDRDKITLSENHVLLPDLTDDMDISQTLSILLADEITGRIPQFDSTLRSETGVVLAQCGKTERGVEATMRVLAQRFRRNLAGLEESLRSLDEACQRTRPSGPYTLQCMMPNVASGRACLQLNLNGPNFVVDSGSKSLESAMAATSLLLHAGDESGTKLVIVTAIDANPLRAPEGENQTVTDEFAAAFAVTTRRHAERLGLNVVSNVETALRRSCEPSDRDAPRRSTARKVRLLLDVLNGSGEQNAGAMVPSVVPDDSSTDAEFPVHMPIWVEAPLASTDENQLDPRDTAILAIAPANQRLVKQLLEVLSARSKRFMVAVAGSGAREVATSSRDLNVLAADLTDPYSITTVLDQIDEFQAHVVVAAQTISSWELSDSLDSAAMDNNLCELLFLVAQRSAAQLKQGTIELWGLFLEGWKGTVHPESGSIAGLLKAINREYTAARTGVICTRGLSLDNAWQCLWHEHSQCGGEQEVVYDGAARLARRLRRAHRSIEPECPAALDDSSVVVATGGARGVTAVMMDALLRDYRCTVIAIGRSSLEAGPADVNDPHVERDFYDRYLRDHPNASAAEMKQNFNLARARWEAHQTVERLFALGGRVEYMVADVTDRRELAKVVRQIKSRFGRIDLLVHGAGIQVSKRLEDRKLAEFRDTFSVKVAGLRNLVDLCRAEFGGIVSAHILTSAYSIFGNDGQHDYGAANETLDRLCGLSKIHDDLAWSSIAWLAWDGVGMTRGSEYHALARQRGLSGLTAEHGQEIFRDVLAGRTRSWNNVPLTEAEHVKYNVKTIPPATGALTGRILELQVQLSGIECLPFHRVRSTPTLPGAWILERMVNAGLQLRHDAGSISAVTIQDVIFRRFVRYSSGHEPNIRVVAEETADGINVWMIGDVVHPSGVVLSKDLVFAQATLSFEHQTVELRPELGRIGAQQLQGSSRFVSDPYCHGQCGDVQLSGPFDCVRDISIGPIGRRARFVPNQTHHDSGVIPAFLLDSAWRVGAMYAVPDQDELFVPVRIGRVIAPVGMNARASSASVSEIRTTAPCVENGNVRWDRTEVLNEIGAVKLIVEDTYAARLQ